MKRHLTQPLADLNYKERVMSVTIVKLIETIGAHPDLSDAQKRDCARILGGKDIGDNTASEKQKETGASGTRKPARDEEEGSEKNGQNLVVTKVCEKTGKYGTLTAHYFTLPNGDKHGVYQVFDEVGKKLDEAYYQHGLLHGLEKEWRYGDHLTHLVYWRQGKRHGQQYCFDLDGKVGKCTNWADDVKHGDELWFASNGVLCHTLPWQCGKLHGVETRRDEQGHLVYSLEWRNGKMHGLERKFEGAEETLVYYCHWQNGEMHGTEEAFKPICHRCSFMPKHRTAWKHNKKHGLSEQWVDNGLWARERYVDGERDGMCEYFFPDTGQLDRRIHYRRGQRQGGFDTYAKDAKVWSERDDEVNE